MLVICPHLSTGGSPQVTVNKIQLLKDEYEIKVIEYSNIAWSFVVQKNRIIDLVGQDNLISLSDNKSEILDIIKEFNPDIISMEEFPEFFMAMDIASKIYSPERKYKIFETTHDSSFNVSSKVLFPDKFIFVSAFNAFRYSSFDIPYEVIEYPIDRKPKDISKRKSLNLESDYKHIVIIGLFTPRKNQKYAFELSAKLSDYKIKFNFIGNQADNFADYWKPLMQLKETEPQKYADCVIWGERADTDDFLQASDMFLFTSRGDKNNKELNPIVIKEALQYDMPMLMFGLDVYCGKYDDDKNITYLTGNIDEDAELILKILSPQKKQNTDEIVIIGTFPNTKERDRLTVDCINGFKKSGRKIMLLSHYPVSKEIQKMVDYYVYDNHNPLTHHSYYIKFYNYKQDYDIDLNINGLKNTNQSLTVLTNLFNGFKAAKDLGYKKALYITYDVILNDLDLPKIDIIFQNLYKYNAHLAYNETPFGFGIETTSMGFDVDFFLKSYDDVRTEDEYNKVCTQLKCQNFLEDYLIKASNNWHENNFLFEDVPQRTLLPYSGVGTSSNSEYYSILPVADAENEFAFYFYTYNIDDRRVHITMNEEGSEFFNHSFTISKCREFVKRFKYSGKQIEIDVIFYDGDDIYKKEQYVMNNSNIAKYYNTGIFRPKVKPKIKLVHIQTTRDDEREQLSRESLQPVSAHGVEYVLHANELYKDLPPRFNAGRPQCVSDKLFTEEDVQKYGTALTPAHYGCYEAFKNAILTEFDSDIDYLIVCEGDCLLEKPVNEFLDKVYQACEIIKRTNIGYFSFGDTKTLDFGWHQSNVIENVPNQELLFITDKIIGLQCIMFPKKARKYLLEKLRTHKWDAADIYFNQIFTNAPLRMGILKERITTQADGLSIIDNEFKTFRK